MGINLNTLAREVTSREAGKINLSIAQVKEVIKCTLIALDEYKPAEILDAIDRTADKYGR